MVQNKNKISILFSVILVCIYALGGMGIFSKTPGVYAKETSNLTKDILGIQASAMILIDAETGQVLMENNSDDQLGIASITKVMTEYLVLEAIEDGKISWDQEIIIDSYVHKLSGEPGLSNVGLTEGAKYTVKELYQAMTIFSGNAASVALAQAIAGTESNFVSLMNKKAEELGLEKYSFVNSSGLNNSNLLGQHPTGGENDENLMSARDVAKLAYVLLGDFPEVLQTSKVEKLEFRDGREYPNFNWMLPGLTFGYEGVDGLKTGTTDLAGACFVATALRNDQRYISVVLNAGSKNSRFEETKKILDYAFATFAKEEVFSQNEKVETIKVNNGKIDGVSIVTSTPISILVNSNVKEEFSLAFVPENIIKDNIIEANNQKEGTIVGIASLTTANGDKIDFVDEVNKSKITETDVVTTKSLERANFFVRTWRSLISLFK